MLRTFPVRYLRTLHYEPELSNVGHPLVFNLWTTGRNISKK